MKTLKKLSVTVFMMFLATMVLTSCKKEAKKEVAKFSVEPQTITVNWTGYKTTDKIAVTGKFEEVKVTNTKEGETALEALNGIEFDIPVISLASGDNERDGKLKELFFAVMEATSSLTGTLNLNDNGTGAIKLTMNGVTKDIPVTYVISSQLVEIEDSMILDDWNAQSALESLAKACFDQHKGPDGVSKTWNEVGVKAAIYLKKK